MVQLYKEKHLNPKYITKIYCQTTKTQIFHTELVPALPSSELTSS